uniref:ADP-ribosylation factor-like protein 13B n=1 Tax=Meloidogyne incognita TaxID=6306 RepID=A0A914MAL1_MELIC
MGNCVGGFKRRTNRIAPWKRNKTIILCFLGVDGAGKTTIVKALQGEDFGTVHQTVGFSRAEVNILKYKVTVYDLGGSQRIREIWTTYFAEVYGIVYVVDSSAASRISENKQIVDELIEVSELMGKPILFLLNKKDLPEAMDEIQFSEKFKLHSMAKRNKTDIRVEGVCAVKGTGKEIDQVIVEGLEWLIDKILDNYENISKGVEIALKKLKERQAQERLERQHRLAIAAALSPEDSPETRSENNADKEEIQERNIEETNEIKANEDILSNEVPSLKQNGNIVQKRAQSSLSNGKINERRESSNSNSTLNRRPATSGNGEVDFKVFEIPNKKLENEEGMEMKEMEEGKVKENE